MDLKQTITNNPIVLKVLLGLWLFFTVLFITKKGAEGLQAGRTDFNNYYVSAVLLSQGESIEQFYDNDWFTAKSKEMGVTEGAKFAPFPPITALLYYPLAGLEFNTAKLIWLILNGILMLILPFRLKRYFGLSIIEALFISSLFFIPFASNLSFGQAYLFLSFLLVEAVGMALTRNKRNVGAIIIAVCALLKYLPILFILYLSDPLKENSGGFKKYVLKQKWIITFTIAIVGILGLSLLFFHDAYQVYLITFSDHIQGDISGQGKHAIGFQSLDSLLNNLLMPEDNPIRHQPMAKLLFKTAFIAAIAWFCFKIFRQDKYRFTAINSSIFIIAAFILVPASASYHFLFLLLPVVFIFKWLMSLGSKRPMFLFIVLLLMVFSIQAHHIPSIESVPQLNYIIHYPRFWCLLLLFGYLGYTKLHPKHG
jgi:hypothetical protein